MKKNLQRIVEDLLSLFLFNQETLLLYIEYPHIYSVQARTDITDFALWLVELLLYSNIHFLVLEKWNKR